MYKRILIALDLEGVNLVVGDPYTGLSKGTEQHAIACRQALLEVNTAADALFEAGAERVALWDNHGGGNNVDPAALDSRIEWIQPEPGTLRQAFAEGEFDCICYFGYHAMEGTLNGVLAHTMNSKANQYYKLNGRYIGEIDMDAAIAAHYTMPSCFFASDEQGCRQASLSLPDIVTVTTKTGTGRNSAVFRDNAELLAEIRVKIVEAVRTEHPLHPLAFPCILEKSWKRMEDAAAARERIRALGIECGHPEDDILGRDAHTLVFRLSSIDDFRRVL